MDRKIALWVVIITLLAGTAVMGQGRGRGGRGNTSAAESATSATVEIGVFGRDEQRIIVDWFADDRNLNGLPPGLAKREHLPPGLQRQLVKNGHLPPGLEKQIQPLPVVLEAKLPPVPDGQKRFIIGGNVILMNQSTSVIVDIFAAF